MYHPGGTIRDALECIERNEYVLPAIQREFVWSPDQIGALFDSLMQGYPFGEFLFWKIDAESAKEYRYYGFVLDYHERDNAHCPEAHILPGKPITAVLDGQQRLTALNIGLRGSMAIKRPYKRWSSSDAFPRRVLALDLLASTEPDEEGNRYRCAQRGSPTGRRPESHRARPWPNERLRIEGRADVNRHSKRWIPSPKFHPGKYGSPRRALVEN